MSVCSRPSRQEYVWDPDIERLKGIQECYRLFATYIHVLEKGYSVGSEEIKKQFDRIMKGEKPWNDAPATADADAGAHNADCSSS